MRAACAIALFTNQVFWRHAPQSARSTNLRTVGPRTRLSMNFGRWEGGEAGREAASRVSCPSLLAAALA
eukprot:8625321-Pyramimonas_sp.AAC.1